MPYTSRLCFAQLINGAVKGPKFEHYADKMREIVICKACSHLYIWFVLYVSLLYEVILLLFNIFFMGAAYVLSSMPFPGILEDMKVPD